MFGPNYDKIEEEHLEGLHFSDPDPHCPLCELDDDRPECPDPTADW